MARCAFGKILLAVLTGVCCSELAAQTLPTQRGDKSQEALDVQRRRPVQMYGRFPLSFEANAGQADERVKFLSRSQGYTLFLTPSRAVFALHRPSVAADVTKDADGRFISTPAIEAANQTNSAPVEAIGISLLGADPQSKITGVDELPGHVSYFLGNDPSKWMRDVPTYGKAHYRQIYPGIDLLFYGNEQRLESDFVIAPGADPAQIRLQFEGGKELRVSREGDLVLHTSEGELLLLKPHVYQEIAGARHDIPGHYVLHGKRTVSFSLGTYNLSAPLVIDPVLAYSTALNGANFTVGNGGGHGIAVDATGNAYVTGYTDRSNFLPTPGAFTTASGLLFVSKLNPAGTGVVYTGVFGGTGSDVAMAITVDAQGNAVVTGSTSSANFPTQNALLPTLPAGTHAFLTKLNAAGSGVLYSTYLGGSGATGTGNATDVGNAVTTDSSGAIYVTGYTNSTDFPSKNGVQPTCPDLQINSYCNIGGFATKLDPSQSGAASLIYSTFLGGKFPTYGQGIAVDPAGNAYITGNTNATDFPVTAGALQTTLNGGTDPFVSVLTPAGNSFVYSTYLGYGFGWGVAVDAQGNAYVTGATNAFGGTFPTTPGAFQTTLSGSTTSNHAFVAKLNSSGTALVYSTFLGGSGSENGSTGNIAIDATGNAYISGFTSSTDFPTTANAIQASFGGGGFDAFVTELNGAGSGLVYSTYLGGTGSDQAYGLTLDAANGVYVMGSTSSANFPTTPGAFEPVVNVGTGSLFVTKIGPPSTAVVVSASVSPAVFGQPVSFTASVNPVMASSLTPTGTVTFSDGATTLGTVTLSSGIAIFSASSLAIGNHNITAAYGGDSNFAPSTSTAISQLVSQAGTTTSLSVSPNPSSVGQSVTLSATVTVVAPGAGMPTGTVTFQDGTTNLGTGTLSSAGSAAFTTSSLASGSHNLTASYTGDTNFTGSTTSSVVTLMVGPVQINVSESIRVNDVSAVLPSATITVPESIGVSDAPTMVPSAMITVPELIGVSDGTAVLPPVQINVTESISVIDLSSAQPQGLATVTSITTAGGASGVTYGTSDSATVTVVPSSGSGTVTGTVTLSVDGGAASSMPLSNGFAIFNLGVLSAGNHSVTANFTAQGSFLGSSTTSTLAVMQAPLTIVANSASKQYGQVNPLLNGVTYSGFVNGDGPASLVGALSCSSSGTQISPVGAYPITCSGLASSNYMIIFLPGTLSVTPAVIIVTANSPTKILNAANPPLTSTLSGFVDGDTSSALKSNPTCGTTAATNSPVGSYPIACAGATAANYTFSYVPGTLKIQYASTIGHFIQPPINADGTSVFKQGRTIPSTFSVYDANGASIGTPGVVSSFFLTGIVSGTTTTAVEDIVDTNNPDTAFRWDPTGQQWIFNITTRNLAAGSTYIYTIVLNDGSTIMFQYGLR